MECCVAENQNSWNRLELLWSGPGLGGKASRAASGALCALTSDIVMAVLLLLSVSLRCFFFVVYVSSCDIVANV